MASAVLLLVYVAMARRASAGFLLDDWTAPRMLSGRSRAPVKTVPSAMHERLRSLRGVMRGRNFELFTLPALGMPPSATWEVASGGKPASGRPLLPRRDDGRSWVPERAVPSSMQERLRPFPLQLKDLTSF